MRPPPPAMVIVGLLLGALLLAGAAPANDSTVVSARVVANPLTVRLSLSTKKLNVDECIDATATTDNLAAVAARDAVVSIVASKTGLRAPQGWDRKFASIPARGSVPAQFRLCGRKPGNYVVLASASAKVSGLAYSAQSDAQVVRVEERR